MKSSLSSSLLEGSLGLGLWLLLTPLAQLLKLLKLLTAAPSLLVPGQRLSSSSFLLEISFLPGKTLYLPKSLALQVTRTCLEHLMWEGRRQEKENTMIQQGTACTGRHKSRHKAGIKSFLFVFVFPLKLPIPALQHVEAQQVLSLPFSRPATHCPIGITTVVSSLGWGRCCAELALSSQKPGVGRDVLGESPS